MINDFKDFVNLTMTLKIFINLITTLKMFINFIGNIFYQENVTSYSPFILLTSHYCQRHIYIQYWYVDGKYRIYLTRLRNGVKDELLASLSPRFAPSQINSIFTVNRNILYLSCNPRCPKK